MSIVCTWHGFIVDGGIRTMLSFINWSMLCGCFFATSPNLSAIRHQYLPIRLLHTCIAVPSLLLSLRPTHPASRTRSPLLPGITSRFSKRRRCSDPVAKCDFRKCYGRQSVTLPARQHVLPPVEIVFDLWRVRFEAFASD